MHHIDDDTRKEVLGEAAMDELKVIREYVQDVPKIRAELADLRTDVAAIDQRLISVEADVKIVKASVTGRDEEVQELDGRVSRLEEAA
jgi:hypothetical protein